MCSRRKRTAFTPIQRQKLEAAYEGGLKSVAAVNLPAISDLASSLDLEVDVVKNFVGNKKRSTAPGDKENQPVQKMRKLSAYNCFSAEFLKSEEAKEIDSLAVKNRKIGELWRGLSIDEKEKYYMLAKEESTPGVGHCGDWKTVSKILSNMNTNCKWADKCGVQMFYVLCYGPNHYAGGTQCGVQYLQSHANIPMDFLHSHKGSNFVQHPGSSSGREEWERCRKAVQEVLILKYALALGNPKAKVPYTTLLPSQVKNFPADLKFGPPSSFGIQSLKRILDAADAIYFDFSTDGIHEEHSYCKPSKSAPKSMHICPSLTLTGSTMLSVCEGTIEDITASLVFETKNKTIQMQTTKKQKSTQKIVKKNESKSIPPKRKVALQIEERVVAKGITLSGDMLHGHALPLGFTKVMIEEVFDPQVKLQVGCYFDDDEQFLQPNLITAWRDECIQV